MRRTSGKMTRRVLWGAMLVAMLFAALPTRAQNWTQVTASHITSNATGGQELLASGTLSFQATDQNNNPIVFQIGGGGQQISAPMKTGISSGAIGTFYVPDPAATNPAGIYYHVTIYEGAQNVYDCKGVQWGASSTFNFDDYACPTHGQTTAPTGSTITGPISVAGTLTCTSTPCGSASGATPAGSTGEVQDNGGSGALGDAGFQSSTVSLKGTSGYGPPLYVSSTGSDSNDGLSWGTAMLTVYHALCSLVNGNCSTFTAGTGTIRIAGGAAIGGTVTGQGIWVMGSLDPNYSSPPSGWLKWNGPVTFSCDATEYAVDNAPSGSCGLHQTSAGANQPTVWLSGQMEQYTFDHISILDYPYICIRLGVDSNGNRANGLGTAPYNVFDHFGCQVSTSSGSAGPSVDIGAGTFQDWFIYSSFVGNSAATGGLTADGHAAVVVNPSTGGSSGLLYFINDVMNSGGIKYTPGSSANELTVTNLTTENNLKAAVWFTASTSYMTANIDTVTVADCSGTCPAVENDGANAAAVRVSNLQGQGVNMQGPMTSSGGDYANNYQDETTTPTGQGQIGIFGNRLVGQHDSARRQFGPTSPRFANIANSATSAWSVESSSTLTQGQAAPDGTTGAGLVSSTVLAGVNFYIQSKTVAVGDKLIYGAWARSTTGNGFYSGAPLILSLQGSGFTCTGGNTYTNGYEWVEGDGDWEWVSGVCTIATIGTNPTTVAFGAQTNSGYSADFYGPVLLYIPSGTVSASEAAEIALHLQSFPNGYSAGVPLDMAGPTVHTTTFNTTGHCPEYTGPYNIGDSGAACGSGGGIGYGADTGAGGANAYYVNPSVAVTLTAGQSFIWTPANSNTTTNVTMDASSTGVENVCKYNGDTAFQPGDVQAGGTYLSTWTTAHLCWSTIGTTLTATPGVTPRAFSGTSGDTINPIAGADLGRRIFLTASSSIAENIAAAAPNEYFTVTIANTVTATFTPVSGQIQLYPAALGSSLALTGPLTCAFTVDTTGANWQAGFCTADVTGPSGNSQIEATATSGLHSAAAATPVCADGNGNIGVSGCSSGGLDVNGAAVSGTPNLNATTPAAPVGADAQAVQFAKSGSSVSAYVPEMIGTPAFSRWGISEYTAANTSFVTAGSFTQVTGACTTAATVNATVSSPPLHTCASGTSANTTQSIYFGTTDDAFIGTSSHPTNLHAVVRAGQSTTTAIRSWFAIISDQSSSTLGTTDSPTSGNVAGIRFSSVAGDTDFMLVLCNASACATTSTGVAADSSIHRFEIQLNDSTGTATACVDGTCVTQATDYPSSVAPTHGSGVVMDNTSATSVTMSIAAIYLSTIQ
jgi:hypothetical protein